ncbi:MAG: response regulator [bacterium]|nr:response regulator [bacterium]
MSASPGSYPGKVLLIDDDSDTRDIYREFLTEAGYEVDLAQDGQEGLAKILQGGYDLILLDIMLPKIDGLGILRKIQTRPQPTHYNGPIIVLSALDQDYIVKEALGLGAKGYLAKSGMTPDQALSKISEFLKDS